MTLRICLFSCLLIFSLGTVTQAQSLLAYYSFDNCDATDDTGNGSNGTLVGAPGCDCGVSGNALVLDGIDDHVIFNGIINQAFANPNFTISFYFKPFAATTIQNLVSKKEACNNNVSGLDIDYFQSINAVSTDMISDDGSGANVASNLDATCWHHYTLVRAGTNIKLYINGLLVEERNTPNIVNLANNASLMLANSPCLGVNLERFRGKIDEFRLYIRALPQDEILDFSLNPDNVGNRDTIIFLGNSVQAFTTKTCAISFGWSPTDGVSDPTIANPLLAPTETTTYTLSFLDAEGCTTSDTLRITVIDPSDLDCNEVFIPDAFTPNDDGLNDFIQISNPQAFQNLISFEIYDKWGNRVFETDDPFATWDGSYQGTPINSGVMLYKLRYECDGTEELKHGTITIMR